MLNSHRFTLDCLQEYAETGDLIDKSNGVFAHSPTPECEGGVEGYYLAFDDHQQQGLLQSVDFERCCFFSPDVKKWLNSSDVWPKGFFELWDIHDRFFFEHNKKIVREYYENQTTEQKESRSRAIVRAFQNRTQEEEHHRLRGVREYNKKLTREQQIEKARIMRETFNARATIEDRKRIAEKARQDNSKPVEVRFPNGLIGTYPSAKVASLFTGIAPTTLRTWASLDTGGKYGKNKGYSAKYL